MMNNIILNGINSNTIQGLIIQELPPISKPAIRTEIEEIDGRDGDVITKLGYAAYDKQLSIGLYGNYDINQVISFFNTSGTVTFSNEPDKYYNYQILNEIDFERLVRFRTAIVTMHVQPFKYSATETPQELSGTVITGEGSNINLVNTTDSGLFTDLQKKGDTFQQTYSGKNLAIVSTGNNILISNQLAAGTYTFSLTLTNNVGFSLRANSSSGTTILAKQFYSTGRQSVTFTLNEATSIFLNGFSLTTGKTYIESVSNYQIETGSTATDYEPYVGGTPSPNPSYPQEIETVTGNNNVMICGKNLLPNNASSTTKNGVTFTINEDKSISISGTASDYADFYLFGYWSSSTPVVTLSSGTYTLSCKDELQNKGSLYIGYSGSVFKSTDSTNTFTTTNNTNISFAFIRIFNGQSVNIRLYPQLEKGSTETDYEIYQSKTYPISLGNIELCMINGTYDYIYKNNGTWYLHKEIGKIVLDGSNDESWGYSSSNNLFVTDVIRNIAKHNNQMYCSHFSIVPISTSYSNMPNGTIRQDNNSPRLIFKYTNYTNVNDFKNWLSTHNILIYYLLETPTDTEITNSTLLSQLNALGNATTYLGTTNISTSGDGLSPIMYVETVAVDDPVLRITNSGNTIAKPIMTLYGTGTINLSLNGEQIFVIDLSSENYITIDIANMEAYYNGILKNRLVTGNYENFVLNQGENEITFTGTLYSLTISNYSRWI